MDGGEGVSAEQGLYDALRCTNACGTDCDKVYVVRGGVGLGLAVKVACILYSPKNVYGKGSGGSWHRGVAGKMGWLKGRRRLPLEVLHIENNIKFCGIPSPFLSTFWYNIKQDFP